MLDFLLTAVLFVPCSAAFDVQISILAQKFQIVSKIVVKMVIMLIQGLQLYTGIFALN